MKDYLIRCRDAVFSLRSSTQHRLTDFRMHHHPRWLHPGQHVAHLAYFAAVCFEAHGMYAIMAGFLFVMGLVSILMGEAEL